MTIKHEGLVTAVMITGKSSGRERLAAAAVESFKLQTWPNKELLIVNDSGESVLRGDHDGSTREVMLPSGVLSLGELRNVAMEQATGEWIIQWDDDDYSHPTRIQRQMELASPGHAVLLLWQVRVSLVSNTAFSFRWRFPAVPGIPGTVLHHKSQSARYRPTPKGEDQQFLLDCFRGRIRVIDNQAEPHLYLRTYHGGNTWDERHIMGDDGGRIPGAWDLPKESSEFLRSVMPKWM